MVHLLPYKPCEFSEAPPLWMLLFPVTLSHSFTFVAPCSLFLSLIHSQAQSDAHPLSHTPDCMWRGRCYAAHVRVLGLLVHFVPSNQNLKSHTHHSGQISSTQLQYCSPTYAQMDRGTSVLVCVCVSPFCCVWQTGREQLHFPFFSHRND